jgi:hypothetical protein
MLGGCIAVYIHKTRGEARQPDWIVETSKGRYIYLCIHAAAICPMALEVGKIDWQYLQYRCMFCISID